MCAFDARIAAPDAVLYDLGIAKAKPLGPNDISTVSGALQAYDWALQRFKTDGTPQVLSNSWGLYHQSWDPFPPGDPGNYTHNLNHPFTRKVVEVMNAGILVVFAAGNCGGPCPDGRCVDQANTGPGNSIKGANGHPAVLCAGAVNLRRERVGYSSQGPSSLGAAKPDLCGYTNFRGERPIDSGTSAACPVVAGALALLRCAEPTLNQKRASDLLRETAINVGTPGYNPDTGAGVINVAAAYDRLRAGPTGATPNLAFGLGAPRREERHKKKGSPQKLAPKGSHRKKGSSEKLALKEGERTTRRGRRK
jgi:hypothetical protein